MCLAIGLVTKSNECMDRGGRYIRIFISYIVIFKNSMHRKIHRYWAFNDAKVAMPLISVFFNNDKLS